MRGGRIFILIGVILGLVTMVAALIIITSVQQPPPSAIPTPMVPKTEKVVVAIQNIGEGDTVIPQMVELREVDLSEIPDGALRSINLALGQIATRNIYQGQVIEETMVISPDDIARYGLNASILIPKGKVAISLPIGKLSSVAYAVKEGDGVDLLITMPFIDVDEQSQTKLPLILSGEQCPGCVPANPQIPRMTTQLLVQDATVLKVGLWGIEPTPQPTVEGGTQAEAEATPQPAEPPDTIVLMVNHQDALVIKYARESDASIDLILRSSGDHDIVTTEPVTLEYMLARFGIVVPPKRPYTLFTFTEEGRQAAQAAAGGVQPR